MPPVTLISVIVVTWNSGEHLSHCLSALAKQTRRDFEVILVDNHSTDDSLNGLERHWLDDLRMTVERLDSNLGFAPANNLGARLARGKWIALLNADAYPEPDWLENLLKAAERNPQYTAFSSRQIQYNAPHLLDGSGDVYHISGLAWRNDYNMPAGTYGLEQREIFSPCAAAAMYRREDFLNVGGFDEDYFSYFEDVDLGFRLRLQGKKCLYVPEAIVHHVGSGSTGRRSDFSVYHGYRNLIWTFFKNMPFPLFWLFLPLHVATLSFFVLYLTFRGQGRVIWKAVFDALHGLPKMIQKRKMIQRNRKVKTGELLKAMSTGVVEPYREFFRRNRTE
ncbi:MAG: glycosyltransferase family 2 protein [Chloroflexi bacterium]|nr:glycosyltransferase family 2 protein [Chloroflexota bacterium]